MLEASPTEEAMPSLTGNSESMAVSPASFLCLIHRGCESA
jgi:hypothetical protein